MILNMNVVPGVARHWEQESRGGTKGYDGQGRDSKGTHVEPT